MAISDLIVNAEKVRKGPPCTVCELFRTLPDVESQALRRLLSDASVRYSALEAALRGEGYDVSDKTLSRHARGRCEARAKLR